MGANSGVIRHPQNCNIIEIDLGHLCINFICYPRLKPIHSEDVLPSRASSQDCKTCVPRY